MIRCREGAYLTVYTALSVTALLALFCVLLAGVRLNTVQMEAELITDIAGDSLLAEYHRKMLEHFGLFWMDTSYGTEQPSIETTEAHLKGYLEKNCQPLEQIADYYLYRDLLGLQVREAVIEKAALATDQGGRVFRRRAVEAVKEEIGLSYLEQIAGWLETVQDYGLAERDMEQELREADAELEALDGQKKKVGNNWITVSIDNPLKALELEQQKGILHLVLEDAASVSPVMISTESLASARRARGELNEGNWESLEEETLWDRLLWQEYLLRVCGYYGAEPEEGLLQYQAEYLIAGKNSDVENLKSVVRRICAIRWAAAAAYLFTDTEKCAQAETAATALMTLLTIPEAAPVAKVLLLLGWSYAEAVYDTGCLLNGENVELLKTAGNWHYDAEQLLNGILNGILDRIMPGEEETEGLCYADYLRILLALTPLEEQTFRMMDVMEMDIRCTPGNQNFRLDGCVDRLQLAVTLESAHGYCVTIRKVKQY